MRISKQNQTDLSQELWLAKELDNRSAEALSNAKVAGWLTQPTPTPAAVAGSTSESAGIKEQVDYRRAAAKIKGSFEELAAGQWNDRQCRERLCWQAAESPAFAQLLASRDSWDAPSNTAVKGARANNEALMRGRLAQLFRLDEPTAPGLPTPRSFPAAPSKLVQKDGCPTVFRPSTGYLV